MSKRVYVTGFHGFLGRHVAQAFIEKGDFAVGNPHESLDLTERKAVLETFKELKPDVVVHCAGQVGGMFFNRDFQYSQLYENTVMGLNVVDAAMRAGVPKIIMAGSSCMYPVWCSKPYALAGAWTDLPNQDVLGYGLAKRVTLLAGQMARETAGNPDVVNLIFPNLYGPQDNFDPYRCHAIPALVRKIAAAKEAGEPAVKMFGTGLSEREFLYVEDAGEACAFAAENAGRTDYNVGDGKSWRIRDAATFIANALQYDGRLEWDPGETFNDNDSQWKKVMESGAFRSLGWKPRMDFLTGIKNTVEFYVAAQGAGVPVNA